ncbi:MAG: 50S ribosomal protein L15e [Methanobacteriota archaeon]
MAPNVYSRIGDFWHSANKNQAAQALMRQRLIGYRQEEVFTRVERPTRLDRARSLGYKAKQGFVVVRTRVRRGSLRKSRHQRGRKAANAGVLKITMGKSIQRIAEERVAKHYPNLEVLNSYWVAQDGKHKYYEVILVDPCHPVIMSDPDLQWVTDPANTKRVFRGKTSAGQKGRGMRTTGRGAERSRPSVRANRGKSK